MDTDTLKLRQQRMRALIEALGGRAAVMAAIGRSESTVKDWMARGAFAPIAYGEFLTLGDARRVPIPRELFGRSAGDHWPPEPRVEANEAA